MKPITAKIKTADYDFLDGKAVIKVNAEIVLNKEQYSELVSKSKRNEVTLEVVDNE